MSPSSKNNRPVPFWLRLRQIMLYPFRGAALATLIGVTLVSLLGFFSFLITLVVWFVAYKFAFEMLRNTADGHMDAPENMLSVDNGTIWRFLGLQVIYLVLIFGASLAGAALTGSAAGAILGMIGMLLLVALMQPGAIMSLAIDGSFGNAVDPSTAFAIMGRVGGAYFAVFGLLFVIQISSATAGDWAAEVMPPVIGQVVVNLFSFWGLFAAFHLMGYLVYQYHEELGYEPAAHRNALPTMQSRDHDLLERAEGLVREGSTAAALNLLSEEIRERAVGLDTHELYRRLLLQAGDAKKTEQHGALYLNLLMMEKQERRALTLLRELLTANPGFVPMQIEDAERLADRAKLLGQAQLALDMWQSLLHSHSKNPSAPRWALNAGLMLSDRFSRDAEARVLLEQALARSEDAVLREKIEAALKPLQQMA